VSAAGNKIEWNGERVSRDVGNGAWEALQRVGADLLQASQRLCPKDRGFNGGLVSTGEVEIDAGEMTVEVTYTAPHASLQHEKMQYKHKGGEQAKYLEQPLRENANGYQERIADAIRRIIGG